MDLPIKLISTDFDGTIFSEFETPPIPAALLDRIAELQAKGVKWVINTGREMASLMETLGRAHIHVQPDYLVLVEREIYERRGGRFVELSAWNHGCAEAHRELFARVNRDVPALENWINERFEASVYADLHSPLCVIAANNGDMDEIHAHLNDYCEKVSNLTVVRNDVYARFSHSAYDKGTALSEIGRLLQVKQDHIFAVGDHLNDLPMLSRHHAAFIAAPGNAVPEVRNQIKREGGYLCHETHGLGVLEALNHFLGTALSAA